MSRQKEFVEYLYKFIGTPYFFGGNSTVDPGLDCSGLILEGLRAFKLQGLKDITSKELFHQFKGSQIPLGSTLQIGDLLFFGKDTDNIIHVSAVANANQVIEAGGTNENGMTRLRPIDWRKDLVSIVRLNFPF